MRHPRDWRYLGWPVLLGIVATIACATLFSKVKGKGTDEIKFPHARHAQAKVECIVCHEDVYEATNVESVRLPAEKKCLECHREQKDKGNCAFCHTDVQLAGPWPKREHDVHLSHAKHIELTKENCAQCHLELSDGRGARPTPPMSACLDCHPHQEQYAQADCIACHRNLTRYPLLPISTFSHQGNFTRDHRQAARSSAQSCSQCHEQTFCQDCHASTVAAPIEFQFPELVQRQFIHRGDYVSLHSIDARADSASCRRCHGTSFCESCHLREGLTPASADPRNPHPPGWGFPSSPNFHGIAARHDIGSCAACHEQGAHGAQSNCVSCHRVGGIGGNPHPPGWTGHHSRQEIQGNAMCLVCHN